ncbi:MAG: hypothetical protein GOV00_03775 [Candidatus Altiarchaeota archaeon]|nr:hypothetical protein [Candidatus Altiarchaeota archaeon]
MAPSRIWSFTNLGFHYDGYHVTDFYRALYRGMVDLGYNTSEWLQARGFYNEGSEAVVSRWIATRESEAKYSLNCMTITSKIIWKNVPKPGTSAETKNPPLVPKGTFDLTINGFIVLDFLNVWGESLILKPFSSLRDNLMRRRMKGNLMSASRKEGDLLIKNMREFSSFLPTIK